MRIRPCIDIHNGKVKQIVGGSIREKDARSEAAENFVSDRDAAWYAGLYRQYGLPGGHIILLNSRSDTAMYEADLRQALAALAAYPGGMQIGGGVCPEQTETFLKAGASHVIVTSYVFREGRLDRNRLAEMVKAAGREHLVLDLSCRREVNGSYVVVTDRWQKKTQLVISEEILDEISESCSEFLIHAADVEGKKGGVEKPLLELLGAWQQKSGFPVTYAGGVHAAADLELIRKCSGGRTDVTVGSALKLFGGELSLEELIRRCSAKA